MKIGFSMPNNWGVEDVGLIFRMAARAEELGYDSVWVSEHVFNVSYVFDRLGSKPYYEPLALLSYIAAITKRVGLGTSVLVLPYHNPIRLAKTAATLDVMSGGRLILGVGVGVIEQEIEAMGSPFAERGVITDEAIAVMKELWTQEDPSYRGRYYSFSGMKFSPKPLQKPHIPLLIGGVSRRAIRRAVSLGDGWHPSSMSPEDLSAGIRYLRQQAEVFGRDLSGIPVSTRLNIGAERSSHGTPYQSQYSSPGDPEVILRELRAFENLGVELVVISPNTGDTEETQATMEMIAQEVMPALQ